MSKTSKKRSNVVDTDSSSSDDDGTPKKTSSSVPDYLKAGQDFLGKNLIVILCM